VFLGGITNATLQANDFFECGLELAGGPINLQSHNIDTSNSVNTRVLYYYVNEDGLTEANFTNAGHVILISCSNSIMENLNLSCTSSGLAISESTNITINSVNSSNSKQYGVVIYKSVYINIFSSNISHNINDGILIYGNSNQNNFSYNNINYNGENGVNLFGSNVQYNFFEQNVINYNNYGVNLGLGPLNNRFENNTIAFN
jgi:hypothetical protein